MTPSRVGWLVAAASLAADQLSKNWLLYGLDFRELGPAARIAVLPFFDMVMVWNPGISYGLFPAVGMGGVVFWVVLSLAAVVGLSWWLAKAENTLLAAGVGLVIGGALGNAIDRLHWPGVLDFVLFHVQTATWNFSWYVFNLSDVAIVAGVVGLLYDSLRVGAPQKRPDPG